MEQQRQHQRRQQQEELSMVEIEFSELPDYKHKGASICSLRSLVSGEGADDSFSFDDYDDYDEEEQKNNKYVSPFDQQRLSQRSITTELAIIASSSPEIKALSESFPITPSFPKEIDFTDSSMFGSASSSSQLTMNENDRHHQHQQQYRNSYPFVSPLWVSSSDIEDNCEHLSESGNRHQSNPSKVETKTREETNHNTSNRAEQQHYHDMDTDVDELALYMERQTLGIDCSPTATSQKENVCPMEEETTPSTNNRSNSFNFKSATKESQQQQQQRHQRRHHRSLSSIERPGCHRRISFNSLPSPAEIVASPILLNPPIPSSKRSRSYTNDDGPSPLAMDFPIF